MTENNLKTADEEMPGVFEMIAGTMTAFREEMEYHDRTGIKIARKTRLILRAVFATLILSAVYLVYMIFQMATNMSTMTTHLEDMYSNFDTMSQNMHEITQTVDSMGRNISGVPVIAESMHQIDTDVLVMKDAVHEINQSINAIDGDMVKINSNMQVMTGRLYNMNRSVNLMGYDVNEMAAPMNSGPMSGFWPR